MAQAENHEEVSAPYNWNTGATAPRDASWIVAEFRGGIIKRVHFAEDLSGSEQPAFSGWFEEVGNCFVGVNGEPIRWRLP